jgi:hypothetical protein
LACSTAAGRAGELFPATVEGMAFGAVEGERLPEVPAVPRTLNDDAPLPMDTLSLTQQAPKADTQQRVHIALAEIDEDGHVET